jgi:outer membrane protein W
MQQLRPEHTLAPMRRLALLLTLAMATPLAAQTEIGAHVAAARASSTDTNGTTLAFDRGRGLGASVTLGGEVTLELAATSLRYDAALRTDGASAGAGTLKLIPITATAQWHFGNLYLGGGAAYVVAHDLSGGELEPLGIGTISVESQRCWLANAGVVFRLREIAVVVDGKYIDYRPRSSAAGEQVRLDLKPVVLSVGLRFKL